MNFKFLFKIFISYNIKNEQVIYLKDLVFITFYGFLFYFLLNFFQCFLIKVHFQVVLFLVFFLLHRLIEDQQPYFSANYKV